MILAAATLSVLASAALQQRQVASEWRDRSEHVEAELDNQRDTIAELRDALDQSEETVAELSGDVERLSAELAERDDDAMDGG